MAHGGRDDDGLFMMGQFKVGALFVFLLDRFSISQRFGYFKGRAGLFGDDQFNHG